MNWVYMKHVKLLPSITANVGIFCIYKLEQDVASMISEKKTKQTTDYLQYMDILFGWNKVHVANFKKTPKN